MATPEIRSEAWRGVFLISDGDLEYFDKPHTGFTDESSNDNDDNNKDDNGAPTNPHNNKARFPILSYPSPFFFSFFFPAICSSPSVFRL